jgi:hypothetical protein
MTPGRVTGVLWWKMGISHFKAVYRRSTHSGYTKDFLQTTQAIRDALGLMFESEPPFDLLYKWPGGSFQGKIYFGTDRLEIGQWTSASAPGPWRIGDPRSDSLITFEGDPDARIPDGADAQWRELLAPSEPWLVMVQLDGSQAELHLRAYLDMPPAHLLDAGLDHVPSELRGRMQGNAGLAGDELPELWFNPDELRDCWYLPNDLPSDRGGAPATTAESSWATEGDPSLGSEYRAADESSSSATPEPFEVDPDVRDRGTRAHALTQNALSEVVRLRGFTPRSPRRGEPNYDIAWEEGPALVVAEVKSVTHRNAEKQLRLALGQVLRYRSLLHSNHRTVQAVIALSSAPRDEAWVGLCNEHDVGLIWMPDLATRLTDWLGEQSGARPVG